jgi:hypothetical protein
VLNTELGKQRHAIQFAGQRLGPAQNRVKTFDAQVDQQTERTTEPFRHSTRLTAARTELAEVSRRLLTRYADPGTVERLDAVLGARPPGTAQMDQAWENMRTEAVANPDLLRRWEQLTDVVGRQVIDGQQQPITPVDPTPRRIRPARPATSSQCGLARADPQSAGSRSESHCQVMLGLSTSFGCRAAGGTRLGNARSIHDRRSGGIVR